MKLLDKKLDKDTTGSVKLVPDHVEDLWHIYNIVAAGDEVFATTFRKVSRDTASGGKDTERIKMKLKLEVETVEFDQDSEELRVRGKNLTENDHVKIGARAAAAAARVIRQSYHTLELGPTRALTIFKQLWDIVHLEVIEAACNPAAGADLAVLLIQEGLAHLVLVGSTCTLTKARIEKNMPRKRGAAAAGFDKALATFFEHCLQALLRSVDFDVVKAVVLAGPGFTKEQLQRYINAEAQKRDLKVFTSNKSRIMLAHASSAYKHSLKDVLEAPGVQSQIQDTKAVAEVKALEAFFAMLTTDSARAFYGPGHVLAAHEQCAIDTLLISDALFRSNDMVERAKWVKLVEEVREGNGTANIFSARHVSGEQLQEMTGVAALLRFPLPDLEDLEL